MIFPDKFARPSFDLNNSLPLSDLSDPENDMNFVDLYDSSCFDEMDDYEFNFDVIDVNGLYEEILKFKNCSVNLNLYNYFMSKYYFKKIKPECNIFNLEALLSSVSSESVRKELLSLVIKKYNESFNNSKFLNLLSNFSKKELQHKKNIINDELKYYRKKIKKIELDSLDFSILELSEQLFCKRNFFSKTIEIFNKVDFFICFFDYVNSETKVFIEFDRKDLCKDKFSFYASLNGVNHLINFKFVVDELESSGGVFHGNSRTAIVYVTESEFKSDFLSANLAMVILHEIGHGLEIFYEDEVKSFGSNNREIVSEAFEGVILDIKFLGRFGLSDFYINCIVYLFYYNKIVYIDLMNSLVRCKKINYLKSNHCKNKCFVLSPCKMIYFIKYVDFLSDYRYVPFDEYLYGTKMSRKLTLN